MNNSLRLISIASLKLHASRLLVAIGFFILGKQLVHHVYVPLTIVVIAIVAMLVCGSIAFGFRCVRPGKITIVNRLAPVFLPLGFTIGRGKMRPIVMCSWAGWTVIGSIGAIQAATGFRIINPGSTSGWMLWLFIVGLVIDGIGLLYCAGTGATSVALRTPGLRPTIVLMAILAGVMIASTLLWDCGWPAVGVTIAVMPTIIVGGFYSIFILIASKARWN